MQTRYEWLYLYAFVQPQTGKSVWYILPVLNTAAFQRVLDDFAKTVSASQDRCVLLVMDRAAWHTSAALQPPEGITIIHQPAYSPEVQPAEHLWQLSDETVKNRRFESCADLQQALDEQCVALMADPERVKAHTLFHWWPRVD